jgi:hypothetical protein
MANEAVLIIETGSPIPFTVANATGIAKGAVCKAADLMTASSANGTNDIVGGIAASEKIASDGKIRQAIFREGIFKVYISGTVNMGDALGSIATYTNYLASQSAAVGTLSGCRTFGTALEDGTNGHQILMELKPQQTNNSA